MCFQDEGVEVVADGENKRVPWEQKNIGLDCVIENHEVDVNLRWSESGSTRKRFFVSPSERGSWRSLIVKTDKQQKGFFK